MERVDGIDYNIREEEVSKYLVILMAKIDWLPVFYAGRKRLIMLIWFTLFRLHSNLLSNKPGD